MIVVALVVLGLCLGSFVNALIYRLHWQETNKKAKSSEKQVYSISSGRSICPHCKHQLSSRDLIPVFSWMALGGMCRYCHKPISWQYPLVEALSAFLFVFSYSYWPYELSSAQNIAAFVLWLFFLTGFIALIVYDIKYLTLPNKIIFPLGAVALIAVAVVAAINQDMHLVKDVCIGFLAGGGLFYVLFQVSGGAWIGGGDVKLGFLLGFLLGGPWPALLMLFLASVMGTLYSVPLLLTKKIAPKSRIPFGPFLILAAIIVQLFGAAIINWYSGYFAV